MTGKFTLSKLQKDIGYQFIHPEILRHARTRRQYYQGKREGDSMEPIATLGDAVLDLIVIKRLYKRGERDEGRLSQDKEKEVMKMKTCALAKRLNYHEYIRWGNGEKQDKIWNSGIDTFDTCIEALIGAVFLDAQKSKLNGVKCAEEMLVRLHFFKVHTLSTVISLTS
jgi:ribonuclease-3